MAVASHPWGNCGAKSFPKDSKIPRYHNFGWPVYLAAPIVTGWTLMGKASSMKDWTHNCLRDGHVAYR